MLFIPDISGTTGKSVQKIVLVIVFYFVDPERKPWVCSELCFWTGRRLDKPGGRVSMSLWVYVPYYWPLLADHIEVTWWCGPPKCTINDATFYL